jgi:hypothetical protein
MNPLRGLISHPSEAKGGGVHDFNISYFQQRYTIIEIRLLGDSRKTFRRLLWNIPKPIEYYYE